ncbi:MAG TPA: transposase, partial [Povalibacter sp.]|nr:transposase [Povalibacter sp.]
MKRSRYSDEQIAYVLRQVESGTAVAEVCRQIGISEATFYIWKKKYANLGAT